MKKFLILALFSLAVHAEEKSVTQSGNTININVNKGGCCEPKCKQQKPKVITKTVVKEVIVEKPVEVIVEKPVDHTIYVTKTVTKKVQKKNRISLLGGLGPTRIDQPQNNRVDLIRGPVGGAMYQRMLNESLSVGIQGQTNQTVLGTVGFDF